MNPFQAKPAKSAKLTKRVEEAKPINAEKSVARPPTLQKVPARRASDN